MLEGEQEQLQLTYARILTDDRHTNLRMLMNADLDGFTPATMYPLVNPDLITNAGVATTLLTLYAKNKVR